MLQARLARAHQRLATGNRNNIRLLYMAFIGRKEALQISQEEEEYVDNNTQANAAQEIQEDDTRQHSNIRITPPPNTYETASAQLTPT